MIRSRPSISRTRLARPRTPIARPPGALALLLGVLLAIVLAARGHATAALATPAPPATPSAGAPPATASTGAPPATPSTGAPPTQAAGETPPAPAPRKAEVIRYRPAGCRSKGLTAYSHGAGGKEVAIGFDDGPAPDTREFVRMLERVHAQATFFMIGEQVGARYRATLLRELADGDVLGDHTFTHPFLTHVSDVRAQLQRTIAAIRALTGYTPCVFRPPYGAYDQSIIRTARSLGLATVLWDVDPSDYTLPGSAAIEQRVLAQVQPGSIIISHDGGGPRGQTLAAYPRIIAALRARGYRIVTIPQLLGFRPVYVPCIRLCFGIGVARSSVPRNAIIERAP